MTLFFPQSTPSDPFISLSYQILLTNCKFSRTSCAFWEIYRFCSFFCKFWLKVEFLHTEWPPFLRVHIKKDLIFLESTSKTIPFFWRPHRMTPLFSTKSYIECPLLLFSDRHLYVTFIFEWRSGVRSHYFLAICRHMHLVRPHYYGMILMFCFCAFYFEGVQYLTLIIYW